MPNKNNNYSKNFSDRLAKILDERTQVSVSKRLGCSRGVIQKYLAGDIPESFELLSKLAKEYDVDLHWLLTGEQLGVDENDPRVKECIQRIKAMASLGMIL
jgi:transcriptional regulator with XRE-family HTH domain